MPSEAQLAIEGWATTSRLGENGPRFSPWECGDGPVKDRRTLEAF